MEVHRQGGRSARKRLVATLADVNRLNPRVATHRIYESYLDKNDRRRKSLHPRSLADPWRLSPPAAMAFHGIEAGVLGTQLGNM